MKINRVLTTLDEKCYCGGQMILAELIVNRKEIVTNDDGTHKIVRHGPELSTETVCSHCITKGKSGMPAKCF